MTSRGGPRRPILVGGFFLASALRLAYLFTTHENWDLDAYREVVHVLENGGELYRDTPRYNYSPAWSIVLRGLAFLSRETGVSLERAVGVLLLLADVLTAWLVFRIARDGLGRPAEAAAGAALLFFANPVSVFTSGFHLQFDNLALMFLLAAVASVGRASPAPAKSLSTVVFLSASLLFKHVTYFHPLLFVRTRRRPGLSLLAGLVPCAVFFASFLPYLGSPGWVYERVFRYRSMAETYGASTLLEIPGAPSWLPTLLFLAAAGFGLLAFRGLDAGRASLLLFLLLLVFLPGVAQYYFVWPSALGALYGGAGYAVYTLAVSAFFLGSPDGLALPLTHLPGWHGVWWATVLWLLLELRTLQREKKA
jgi:hypothetical protein